MAQIKVENESIIFETNDTNLEMKNLSIEEIDDLMLHLSMLREVKKSKENEAKG